MGSVLGKQMEKVMDDNMKKQQDFMLSSQKMQVSLCAVWCGILDLALVGTLSTRLLVSRASLSPHSRLLDCF